MMGSSSRNQIAHESSVKYLQHKEKKKNNTMTQFQEMECTMHQNLFTLIKDTSCLKEYTGLAYGILQEAFAVAHGAFPLHKHDTRLLSYGDGISSSSRVSPTTPGPLSVRTLAQTHALPMPKVSSLSFTDCYLTQDLSHCYNHLGYHNSKSLSQILSE